GCERGRYQGPDGREDQGGIERFWRWRCRVARPLGAEASRELLLLRIAGRGEGKDAATLVASDLRDDVRRVAETIKTHALGIARQPERAVADQASAEQRGCMQVVIAVGQRQTKAFVGDAKLGIAAVELIAGEARVDAKVLEAAAAEAAGLVDRAEPGNANADTGREPVRAFARGLDPTDDHVADHEWELGLFQLTVHDVEVGTANRAHRDTNQDLTASRLGDGQLHEAKGFLHRAKLHRPHRLSARR